VTAGRRLTFGDELDRTRTVDLEVLVPGRPAGDVRRSLLERVRAAAAEPPDRTATVARARREVAEHMLIRLNRAGLVVTWAGIPWAGASPLRTEDRVWLTMAAQDAAVADVLADRLTPADRDELRAGWEIAASMPGLGFDGAPTIRGPRRIALIALFPAAFLTGAWSFMLMLAVGRRRRPRSEPED
jgi:hypothetical protein